MTDDAELLRRYAEEREESAFAEIVRRHLDLAYAVALRKVGGDVHLAKDVVQQVFADLARKAATLRRHRVLAGWLFTSVHFAATQMVRAERRRRAREQKAAAMNELLHDSAPAPDWERLRPLLDDLVLELNEREREAVLLRYFEGRAFREVAEKMNLSDDGARARVDRAVGKLQALLGRRGITSTAAALGLVLGNQAGMAAPAGLVQAVTGVALAGSGSSVVVGAFALFAMNKLQTALLAALFIGGSIAFVWERHQTQAIAKDVATLRAEHTALLARRDQDRRPATAAVSSNPTSLALPTRLQAAAPLPPGKLLDEEMEALLAAGMKPFTMWKNQGRATPEAALETLFWAGVTPDFDALAPMIVFDERGKAKLDAWFQSLAPELRVRLGTPERAIAPAYADVSPLFQQFVMPMRSGLSARRLGYKLVRVEEPDRGGSVKVQVIFSHGSDPDRPAHIWFQPGPDGWRCGRLLESTVEHFTDRIDPVTGALVSKPQVASP